MAKIKNGFVLAGFPGYRYQDFEVQLQPGDTIFTYTDGIPEAINDKNEEFGLDRLQKVLNDSKDSPVRLMCRKVRMVLQTRIDTPTWNGIGKFGANNVY